MYNAPSIADYDPSTLVFDISSEIFASSTISEDGTPMEGSIIVITATTEDGVVFARQVGVTDWQWSISPDEFGDHIMERIGDPVALNEKAGLMLTKLNMIKSPRLNPVAWQFYRAVYGSIAYTSLGIEEAYAEEERRELRGF